MCASEVIHSPQVIDVLQRYGWFPGRSVELESQLLEWQLREIAHFPVAEAVLRSLGGIDIDYSAADDPSLCPFPGAEGVSFCHLKSEREEGFRFIRDKLGLSLFPVGEVGWADMLLDATGRVYVCFGPIALIGDDIDDALMGLLTDRDWVRISDGR